MAQGATTGEDLMGTNYYLKRECDHDMIMRKFALPDVLEVHIGKQSNGWQFVFHGYKGVVETRSMWEDTIHDAIRLGWNIVDDYGSRFTFRSFFNIVDASKGKKMQGDFVSNDGWSFIHGDFS